MLGYEHCILCDAETGKAGRLDDSIYLDIPNGDEIGPLCETCYDAFGESMEKCKKVLSGSEKPSHNTDSQKCLCDSCIDICHQHKVGKRVFGYCEGYIDKE